jgi:hypothetical protein
MPLQPIQCNPSSIAGARRKRDRMRRWWTPEGSDLACTDTYTHDEGLDTYKKQDLLRKFNVLLSYDICGGLRDSDCELPVFSSMIDLIHACRPNRTQVETADCSKSVASFDPKWLDYM